MKKLKLGSIEEEAAACRKAFKGVKVGTLVIHCHHEVLGEPLTEDAENRISFILRSKEQHEQALRLRLFRPVSVANLRSLGKKYPMIKEAYAESQKADAERQKAYAERQKADAEWSKADAESQKADAEWQRADAEWSKAKAEWQRAYAEWSKAKAEWQRAYAESQKAYAEWSKADAERSNADAELAILVHPHVCKNCPWDGKTIFPKANP